MQLKVGMGVNLQAPGFMRAKSFEQNDVCLEVVGLSLLLGNSRQIRFFTKHNDVCNMICEIFSIGEATGALILHVVLYY